MFIKRKSSEAPLSEEDRAALTYFRRNFRSISDATPEDFFVVGFPKSGHTWMQNIIASLVYGVCAERAPVALAGELVPDVHKRVFYRRWQTPSFFKSHFLPRPEYRNVIYLLRDGRDAMVSYWHFQSAYAGRQTDFLQMVRDPDLFPCRWHDHVNAWITNPHHARLLIIRYEDLVRQPVHELARLVDFIGLPLDRAQLELVAEQTAFEKLQTRERLKGKPNPLWPKEKFFFRRGIIGSYQDEMPPDVLDAFMTQARPTLEKHGYHC